MSNDTKRITVRLSIEVPLDGSPPTAITQTGERTEPAQRRVMVQQPKLWGQVYCPAPNSSHPVEVIGSGMTGVIYADGKANSFNFGYPAIVKGHCVDAADDPPNPPAGSASGNIDPFTGEWSLDDIPGAQCDHTSSGYYQVLKLWYYETGTSTTHVDTDHVPFYGYCSDSTGCDDGRASLTAVYLPTMAHVEAAGFTGVLDDFNGKWDLQVVPCDSGCREVAWERPPAANGEPHVQLIGDAQRRTARLVFRRESVEITFWKHPGDWHPMNRVEFSDSSCRGVPPGTSIPAIVSVDP